MKRLAVIGVILLVGTAVQPLRAEGPVASDPIGPEEPLVIEPPIELEIEEPENPPAAQPPRPASEQPAPGSQPTQPPAPRSAPPAQTNSQGLQVGQYLQLAFFGSPESVERFKRQVANQNWASEVITWYDETAGGHRVLLGPFAGAELSRRRQILRAEGFETFRYTANP